ncbi:MAG: GNAT family N-acetyltransferase [Bacteroidetes bacterium]|nr:GNAT family N-acetyltransferase [Bacteroidota bacterium]
MQIIKTRKLTPEQFSQINKLWNDEYPIKLKDRFPILLEGVENYHHYIMEDSEQNIIAWAVDFEKENEIRFSIIVHSNYKGKGWGSLLVNKLKSENELFYGWVIDHNDDLKNNGEYYQTPMPFYLKHGFEILASERLETEMIRAVKIKWRLI